MSEWVTQCLVELTDKIGSGATPRGGKEAYKDEGISLIRSQNVLDFSFTDDGLAFIDDSQAEKLKNVIVEKGDVLINITGDSVARVCEAPFDYLPARVNQHVAILRPSKKLDTQFLKYYMLAPRQKKELIMLASSGATRNALTKGMLENYEITHPPLPEQKAIAHILGKLDDKIELNRKMNETLEGMAQALFKSWFVDFDPVLDNALAAVNKIPEALQAKAERRKAVPDAKKLLHTNPELAKLFSDRFEFNENLNKWIPEGWEVKKLETLADCNKKSWSKKNSPEEVEYVDLSNAKNGEIISTTIYTYSEAPSRAKRILTTGDTIFGTVRPGNRSFAYIGQDGLTGSTGFAVFSPKRHDFRAFVYNFVTQEEIIDLLAHLADGAAYPAINSSVISELELVVPTDEILKLYQSISGEGLNKIVINKKETETLTKLRDTLLPQLISGKVRVPTNIIDEN